MPLVAVAVLSCHDSSLRACPCLAALGLCSCEGSSLGAAPRLLIAVASPVAKHGLQGFRAPESWSTGLVALRHVEYSRTRGRTCVPPPSTGKQTPATGPPEKSWTYIFISLGYLPRVGIAGSCGNFVFNQFKKNHSYFLVRVVGEQGDP